MTSKNTKSKVFVGLSGGVDSSVSAALLQEQGYDVVGVFIKVWQPDFFSCTWQEDQRDAMRVCAKLKIPFLTFDAEFQYKKRVVDYMVKEYREGRTPNPDIMCNRHVKFGVFLDFALEGGADFIATGHYAQNILDSENNVYELHKGLDKSKDQSYFLWKLTQSDLGHILFPVGHLLKSEVRKRALSFDLPTANKKDSQGLCFVGKVNMQAFLKHFIHVRSGVVLDESGMAIGTHIGAPLYTLGQRHGFSVDTKSTKTSPHYVTRKDVLANTITVSDQQYASVYNKRSYTLNETNWILGTPPSNGMYEVRYRYRQKLLPARLESGRNQEVLIEFPHSVADASSGQSMVLYDGERCLGGGIIL
jgi:tRNA-uridine 2-sulfurtransferase